MFYFSPVDFLVSPRQRLMYSILFAIMGTGITNGYSNFQIGSYVKLEGSDPYTQVLNKTCECLAGADP